MPHSSRLPIPVAGCAGKGGGCASQNIWRLECRLGTGKREFGGGNLRQVWQLYSVAMPG
ncbi:hypothetical protein D3C75_1348640 [compost metagenome]